AHQDTSTLSVIIPLNTDFEGGELFFVRKTSNLHKDPHQASISMPSIAQNTSEFFFPDLKTGHATCYDNSVWHGIRPVTKGWKYSLVFFFDMPEIDGVIQTPATFVSRRSKPVDLYFIPINDKPHRIETLQYDTHASIGSYVGHLFRTIDTRSGKTLFEFKIEPLPPRVYIVEEDGSVKSFEFETSQRKLRPTMKDIQAAMESEASQTDQKESSSEESCSASENSEDSCVAHV
ncbi:hypothetical protein AAMO2058_001311000, partial [Amorphochlora amoebiformis]